MADALDLHPDRAFPADPSTRSIARRLYDETRALPLVCMHGHVDVTTFAENTPFKDPASMLVTPDHYVTRMLVSQGTGPEELGIARRDGTPVETDPRAIWLRFCEGWRFFRGTPSRYWLDHELAEVFDVKVQPSAETANEIYDTISECLQRPEFRPRALLDRFNIELISTTDPATSDLRHHARLRSEGLGERVVPTFRPDALTHLRHPSWRDEVRELGSLADMDTSHYGGFLDAIRQRRHAFVAAGGRATDHGHTSAATEPLSDSTAAEIFERASTGAVGDTEAQAFAEHMLGVMAQMSCEDGLVMQLHSGVLRNYDTEIYRAFGSDTGFDIPVASEYTKSLRPLLERYGRHPHFRLILFTVDEATFSRELAPLAGVYPSVRLGAPWWFLDSPDGMRRFRELTTETAGFYNTSGFVDDTRAFASIPARHDLARRIDSGYLARLVAEHRLSENEAAETATDLAYNLPRLSYEPLAKP